MVDTTNIKSNFVKGLEENNNRILSYVTIFFTFAFLGCLIAFWIYEHRSSRCVFGPACCHTELVNTGVGRKSAEVTLLQAGTSIKWGSGETFPEIITFETTNTENSSVYSFNSHLYSGILTAGGTSFPRSTSNSGYHLNTDGVSIYFGDYYTQNWSESHLLVTEGISVFIGSPYFKPSAFAQVVNISSGSTGKGGGITYYASPTTINDGTNNVRTTFSQTASFFSNFQKTRTGAGLAQRAVVNSKTSDSSTYNPLTDFLRTKSMVEASNNCSGTGLAQCRCIDPSSRNLPSCKGPYNKKKGGYGVLNAFNKISGYSLNCSHSYLRGVASNATAGAAANGNAVEELIPQDTTQGQNLSKSWTPGDPGTGNSRVNINFAGQPFSGATGTNPGTDKISNPFVARGLFCAQNGTPGTGRQLMYKPTSTAVQGVCVIDGIRNSNLPYAKKLANGSYQLGFG